MKEYVLGIDQSTQGTKALLFDEEGRLLARTDLPHRQMIDEKGSSTTRRRSMKIP